VKATHCKRGHLRCPKNLYGKCCKVCSRLRYKSHAKEETERKRIWRKEHPKKARLRDRNKTLKRKGWNLQSVEETKREQNNRCAICRRKFAGTPFADHKHQPPKPRGLLCLLCNSGLGMFRDNAVLCETAAMYLRKWESTHGGANESTDVSLPATVCYSRTGKATPEITVLLHTHAVSKSGVSTPPKPSDQPDGFAEVSE
jgi:Recombination endonuclease VII